MIIHRIADAFRRQDWLTVFVETLIVVLGVFLGLQAQEWSKRQDDRSREMQIVADMLADIEIDRAQYANALTLAVRRVAAANASLQAANLAPIEFDYTVPNADIVDYAFDIPNAKSTLADQHPALWTDMVIGYFPTPSTSTYDAMVGAGEIKIIRDRRMVRAIQVYRNLIGSVERQNDKLISIRTHTLNVGATYGLAPYTPLQSEAYFQLISTEPELAASIRILATFTIFHYGEIKSADAQAALLEEQLKSYIQRTQ